MGEVSIRGKQAEQPEYLELSASPSRLSLLHRCCQTRLHLKSSTYGPIPELAMQFLPARVNPSALSFQSGTGLVTKSVHWIYARTTSLDGSREMFFRSRAGPRLS